MERFLDWQLWLDTFCFMIKLTLTIIYEIHKNCKLIFLIYATKDVSALYLSGLQIIAAFTDFANFGDSVISLSDFHRYIAL